MGILASIVIVMLNPKDQIDAAHDAQRKVDVNTIVDAVHQFQIDEWRLPRRGSIGTITSTPTEICEVVSQSQAAACAIPPPARSFLGELVPAYITKIPQDPDDTDAKGTGYYIWQSADERINVRATLSTGELFTVSK